MIDTVSFDLDDTLWDNKPVIVAAEQQLAQWVTERAPALAPHYRLETLLQYRHAILQAQPQLRYRISELRQAILCHALKQQGYGEEQSQELAEEGFALFLAARHSIQPYAEAESLLATLSQRFTLVALTNGNADINRLPLGKYFSHSYRAEQLDLAKPDPAFYRAALTDAGLDMSRTLHVGDDYQNDVEAARAAGLLTLWFNPKRDRNDGEAADIEVQQLDDIAPAIERFCSEK